MSVIAVVCPHPPVLVPELAGAAAGDLDDLRAACDGAVAEAVAENPARVVVVGTGDPVHGDASAGGSLAPYGVDVRAGGPELGLPLDLTLGAWLLDRAGWSGDRLYTTRPARWEPDDVLLVMADGSATRTQKAPGYIDERSADFDAQISRALSGGDAAALAELDLDLAEQLWCAGAPALRWLGEQARTAPVTARLAYNAAPYGVGYWVALWTWG